MIDSDGDDASGDAQKEARARVRQQVEDALELANYVVETGVTGSDDQPISFADISAIQATAATIGILDLSGGKVTDGALPLTVSKEEWLAFEQAYYRLAVATRPVTAETLRNTRSTLPSDWEKLSFIGKIKQFALGDSPALRFTRVLLCAAIGFAIMVIVAEWQINVLGMKANADLVQTEKDLWRALLPWTYGGLGACAYLLRSAHTFIYQRCFDIRRKPEYTNRILLGSISGGAIILFSNYLASEDDTVTHFGSAALGFIAGYSTDFLFNTIERIVTAIFPKVQIETVPDPSAVSRRPTPALKKPDPNSGPAAPARNKTKTTTGT
jgi:hypothetical protein